MREIRTYGSVRAVYCEVNIYSTYTVITEEQMKREEILRKVKENKELTIDEIKFCQSITNSDIKQVYGKYGTLAKHYIEEYNKGKMLSLVGKFPEYLHNIDKQASELYDILYAQLSVKNEIKRTGNFSEDMKRISKMQSVIDEVIMNQLVYENE